MKRYFTGFFIDNIKEISNSMGPLLSVIFFLQFLNIRNTWPIFGYLFIVLFLLKKKNSILSLMDRDLLWIFLFSLVYTVFNTFNENGGVQFLIIQIVFPSIFYMFGKIVIDQKTSLTSLLKLLLLFGVIYALPALLTIASDLINFGFLASERTVPDFWTGAPQSATGLASFIIYTLLIPGILLTAKKTLSKRDKIFYLLIYLGTLLCSFRLGSRTCLAITGISIFIGASTLMRSQNFIENIRFIFSSILVLGIGFFLIPSDINLDFLSVLGDRLLEGNASSIGTAGNRTGLWSEAIENIFEHPLGWTSNHYAHNTWLDIAKIGGVVSMLLFIITNAMAIKNLYLSFNLKVPFLVITTTFCLYLFSSFLIFFGEPIILGNYLAIIIFYFFCGMLKQYALKVYPELVKSESRGQMLNKS